MTDDFTDPPATSALIYFLFFAGASYATRDFIQKVYHLTEVECCQKLLDEVTGVEVTIA